MALVQIARFEDPYEGEIAAAGLRAGGIQTVFHHHGWAAMDFTMRRACGGFVLWVSDDDAGRARQYLRDCQPEPDPEAAHWVRHPKALSGVPLAALGLLDARMGWLIVGARQRPTAARISVVVLVYGFMLAAIVAMVAGFFQ